MSCRNLETVITELARDQMLEASVREKTLGHLEACADCASRFADEQMLTAGLRNVASMAAGAEAPAHVEASLVSAFRRRSETPLGPVVAPAYRTLSRWATVGIAAAAALLAISAFAVSRLLFVGSGDSMKREARIEQPAPHVPPTIVPKESEPSSTGAEPVAAADDGQKPATISTPQHAFERQRGLMRNAGLTNRAIHNAPNPEKATNANEEITTEFLPLTYGGLSQLDDGQVVRIEIPRSALQSFGLPINVERTGERVKADVLLSHDGVARAIRFVR